MRFDSIIFILDRRMAVFRETGGKNENRSRKEISLEGLSRTPLIPRYHYLEEESSAGEEIREELHPFVKGFLQKKAILLCMPDDAPVYTEQRYIRDFFIRQGAGTNSAVCTLESLCRVKGSDYAAISCSERLLTLTSRRGQEVPKRMGIPLSLADPETARTALEGLRSGLFREGTDIYIPDPEGKLKDYYFLGKPLDLEKLADYAFRMAENNWV